MSDCDYVPTHYAAEAFVHRPAQFEKFLIRIPARHVRAGDRVWFNGDWTYSYLAEPRNVKSSGKFRTVRSVEYDSSWRIVKIRFKNPLVKRTVEEETEVMIDASGTRGYVIR